MSRISHLTDSLLPQPPSFSKKKQYEILDVLGTGSFGKVMVRLDAYLVCPMVGIKPYRSLLNETGGKMACTRRRCQRQAK